MSDNKLSDEDKALFRSVMQTVKPLKQARHLAAKTLIPCKKLDPVIITTERRITETKKTLEKKPLVKIPQRNNPTSNYSLSSYYSDTVHADSTLSYCKQSIPRKRLSQLKNGQIPWQARLDLHGLGPDAARESLCHFIEYQSRIDNRCLLIIHGKGGRHGEAPILKNHVNHWLQQLPQVLAFHSTLARDGGNGALYVLLQRQR